MFFFALDQPEQVLSVELDENVIYRRLLTLPAWDWGNNLSRMFLFIKIFRSFSCLIVVWLCLHDQPPSSVYGHSTLLQCIQQVSLIENNALFMLIILSEYWLIKKAQAWHICGKLQALFTTFNRPGMPELKQSMIDYLNLIQLTDINWQL